MAKTEATVEELVNMIERGKLRLPEMQRRYVWRSTRVRDLLDSLYRVIRPVRFSFGKPMKGCPCKTWRSRRKAGISVPPNCYWMVSSVLPHYLL